MMVGEMDYMDMFYGNVQNEASAQIQQQGPLMGHLLYAAFVILICIILMNLFIGLTVSDIQVVKCFGSFILTFASIFMGFALAFCILFFGVRIYNI